MDEPGCGGGSEGGCSGSGGDGGDVLVESSNKQWIYAMPKLNKPNIIKWAPKMSKFVFMTTIS